MVEHPATAEQRLLVLKLADELGSVTEACRRHGISRVIYYRWKRRYETGGVAALDDRPSIARAHPRSTPKRVSGLITDIALTTPTATCRSIADQLSADGITISAVTVQKRLSAARLATRENRWLALEHRFFSEGQELSNEQLAFVEDCNPNFTDRHLKRPLPGAYLCGGVFKIPGPDNVGYIRVIALVETFTGFVTASVHPANGPIDAYSIIHSTIDYYRKLGIRIRTLLSPSHAAFQQNSYIRTVLDYYDISIRTLKDGKPSFVERLRFEMLRGGQDLFQVRPYSYPRPDRFDDPLLNSVDQWIFDYNRKPYSGFPNRGSSPAGQLEGVVNKGRLQTQKTP